ncbi:thiol-disulfide oxidoreductase DCC family protein [Thalassotalea fusca]
MSRENENVTVFYDGACPRCVKDRRFYEKLAGQGGKNVNWLDITNQDEYLKSLGIDPYQALTELHIKLPDGRILSELDAYIVLMERVWQLKWLAWIISLPIIRPYLARKYHQKVNKRLKDAGRI